MTKGETRNMLAINGLHKAYEKVFAYKGASLFVGCVAFRLNWLFCVFSPTFQLTQHWKLCFHAIRTQKSILKNHHLSCYELSAILVCQNLSSKGRGRDWNSCCSEASRLSTLWILWRRQSHQRQQQLCTEHKTFYCFTVASEKITTSTMREKLLLVFSISLFRFPTNNKSITNIANR